MSIKTAHIGLDKLEPNDLVSAKQFNDNMDKLDAEIDGLKTKETDLQNEVDGIQMSLRSYAAKSDLDRLTGRVSTLEAAEAARKDQRVITFRGSKVEIRYPWAGVAQQIQINCAAARTTDINFQVEHQTKDDYQAARNNWQKLGGRTFNLPPGKVYMEYSVADNLSTGDVIRFTTENDDSDVTVEVFIQNN